MLFGIISAGPVLLVALGIGLLIGIIQAATSINEMTLSFVQASARSSDVSLNCQLCVDQIIRLFCFHF